MKSRIISIPGERHRITEDFWLPPSYDSKNLTFAVGDFASNVRGGPYADREVAAARGENPRTRYTGGVIGAHVAKKVLQSTDAMGYELIELMNRALAEKYEQLIADGYGELRDYREDRSLCFSGVITRVIATPDIMSITWVGDVSVAADGEKVAGDDTKTDQYLSRLRRDYIMGTGDVNGAYDYLRAFLIEAHNFHNNPAHPFGCPAIKGTVTLPREGVKTKDMPTPDSMVIWTDGYVDPSKRRDRSVTAEDYTIEGLEEMLAHVYEADQYRYQAYPAVGYLLDDRTALEITDMHDWSQLRIEGVQPIFRRK